MGKVKDEQLFTLLRDFLLVYLPNQRKASSNTVKAYRTTLNQFLKYTAEQKNISVLSVTSGMVTYEMVNSYLDWLSAEKNAAPATRNNRLAAIRAFISYAAACRPEYISIASGLAAIGIQKNDRFAKVDYMSEEAVKTLLAEPDTRTEIGERDQFLMIFLYDTGARIQEVLDVKICDIKVDRTPTVTLHGKGKKTRIVPLMKDTVKHLQNYMKVQKIRFGEDVVIRYEADEDVLQCRTIKLILQPLVENAIHHGRREEEVLTVGVSVRRREERVIYEVCDDGLGIEPEKLVQLRTELKQSQEGYGLKNVDIRVKLRYGEGYGVSIMSIPDKGTCVRVEIPAEQG